MSQQSLSGFSPKIYQYEELDLRQRSTYPPLKMIFVVDNSDTMRLNQINLAQSFSAMFDGSSSGNLTPYEAQFFVINTAQANGDIVPSAERETKFPLWGGAEIPLGPRQSFQDFISLNRSRDLSGLIAGDVIGFRTL
ncbi:MAG: hypothetical protein WCH11_07290, partial [Bdellovibrio sp.]